MELTTRWPLGWSTTLPASLASVTCFGIRVPLQSFQFLDHQACVGFSDFPLCSPCKLTPRHWGFHPSLRLRGLWCCVALRAVSAGLTLIYVPGGQPQLGCLGLPRTGGQIQGCGFNGAGPKAARPPILFRCPSLPRLSKRLNSGVGGTRKERGQERENESSLLFTLSFSKAFFSPPANIQQQQEQT